MNYCQIYFQKNLDDLTAEDLINFFSTPQKETQFLEFKSSREQNPDKVFSNTLKPGICSFLNSEGGILIYGAPKENKKNPDNPFQGEIEPYENGFLGEHDTIIRKISGGIIPMPVGVRLKEVKFPDGFVAVFEIQQSQTKPHQTDNVYQIRIDGQKIPAPHYLIEAMMKRISYPDIRAYIKVIQNRYTDDGKTLKISFYVVFANISELLNEKNLRYKLQLEGPMEFISDESDGKISARKTKFFKVENVVPRILTKHKFIIKGDFGMISSGKSIRLEILFHAESSPAKITVYNFNIISKDHRGYLSEGKANLIIDNIPLSEYQKKEGISNVELLMEALDVDK